MLGNLRRHLAIVAAALLTGLLAGSPVHAQQAGDDAAVDVVVTAQRRTESANHVGISLSVLTPEQLQDRGIVTAQGLEVSVPGLTVSDNEPTGVPVYTLRGVGFDDFSTASSSTVGLYNDEQSIPYAIMSKGAFFDLERVEVLKGPQGDLYGRNTTAGQINFISNKPTDDFRSGISYDLSRFATNQVEGFVSGPVAPEVDIRLAAKVTESADGWQDSISRPGDTLGLKDSQALRAQIAIGGEGDLTALLNLHWNRDASDTQAGNAYGEFLPGRYPTTPFIVSRNNQTADWPADYRPTGDESLLGAYARINWKTPLGFDVTSLTAYDNFQRDDRYAAEGVPYAVADTRQVSHINAFSQELRVSGDPDADFYWLAGLFGSADWVNENYAFNFRDSFFGYYLGINTIDTRYSQATTSEAGFAHTEWKFLPGWKLTLGGRVTHEERHWKGCTFDTGDGTLAAFDNVLGFPGASPVLPGGCGIYDDITGSRNAGQFAPYSNTIQTTRPLWKVSLSYDLSPDALAYANISNGFKSGGFAGVSANTQSQLQPYKPETLTAYELGLKASVFDRRIHINTAGFYYDYHNKQEGSVAVTPVGNISTIVNVPKSEVAGWEADVSWRVIGGLTLTGAASYLHTEVLRYNAIDSVRSAYPNVVRFDAAGSELGLAPRWQANGTATYTWDFGGPVLVRAATDVIYKSPSMTSVGGLPISDYVLVNLRLGLEDSDGKWSATLYGRNVFDRHYWLSAFTGNQTYARFNGLPAIYGVRATYNF